MDWDSKNTVVIRHGERDNHSSHVVTHRSAVSFVATLYGLRMQESYGLPLKLKPDLDIKKLWEYDSCPPAETTVLDDQTI